MALHTRVLAAQPSGLWITDDDPVIEVAAPAQVAPIVAEPEPIAEAPAPVRRAKKVKPEPPAPVKEEAVEPAPGTITGGATGSAITGTQRRGGVESTTIGTTSNAWPLALDS